MAKVNPLRFSSKYQDDETDLLYYGYRYYNPSTGTFLSKDPAEEAAGLNLTSLVSNDPLDRIDAVGLCAACTCDSLALLFNGKTSVNLGIYAYDPKTKVVGTFTPGKTPQDKMRFGISIDVKWNITGEGCKFLQNEKGTVEVYLAPGPPPDFTWKPAATIQGHDNSDAPQSYTDPLGAQGPPTGSAYMKIVVNMTIHFICTGTDGIPHDVPITISNLTGIAQFPQGTIYNPPPSPPTQK